MSDEVIVDYYRNSIAEDVRSTPSLDDLLAQREGEKPKKGKRGHTMGLKLVGYVNTKFTSSQISEIELAIQSSYEIQVHGVYPYHIRHFMKANGYRQVKFAGGRYRLKRERVRGEKIFNLDRPFFIKVMNELGQTILILITFPSKEYMSQYAEVLLAFIKYNLQLKGRVIENYESKFTSVTGDLSGFVERYSTEGALKQFYYSKAFNEFPVWSGLKEFCDSAYLFDDEVVLIGYVDYVKDCLMTQHHYTELGGEDKGKQFDLFGLDHIFGVTTLVSPDTSRRVVLFGFRHSYWGSTAASIVWELLQGGARYIIYCAKAGTRTVDYLVGDDGDSSYSATGMLRVIQSKYSLWQGTSTDLEGVIRSISPVRETSLLGDLVSSSSEIRVASDHISVPTVVGEDFDQFNSYVNTNPSTVDNEIAYIAEKMRNFYDEREGDVQLDFSCVHYITDYVVSPENSQMSGIDGLDVDDYKRKKKMLSSAADLIQTYVKLYGVPDISGEISLPSAKSSNRDHIVQYKTDSTHVGLLERGAVFELVTEILGIFNLRNELRDNQSFFDVLQVTDERGSIVVNGEPGVGKSVLAQSTYRYLKYEYKRNNIPISPIYVDLASFEKKIIVEREMPIEVIFAGLVSELEKSLEEAGPAFIIFDGVDRQSPFSAYLSIYLNSLKPELFGGCTFIYFCRRYRNRDFGGKGDANILGVNKGCNAVFNIGHNGEVNNQSSESAAALKHLVHLLSDGSLSVVSSSENDVEKWLEFSSNLRLLSLVSERNSGKKGKNVVERNSAYGAPFDFFTEFLTSYVRKNAVESDFEKIRISAEEVSYEFLMSDADFPSSDYLDVLIKRISTQSIEMLCYLAASYIDRTIFEPNFEEANVGKLDRVYPYLINKYAKDSMLKRDASYCVGRIKSLLAKKESPIKLRSFLCYLIGRIEDVALVGECVDILRVALNRSNEASDHTDEELTLERTIHISLIYLGESSEEYIQSLIDDPEKDSVNRGFHLSYYGDKNYFISPSMSIHDSCDGEIGNTELSLMLNLNDFHCEANKLNLSIYTLYSLAFARHEISTANSIEHTKELLSYARNDLLFRDGVFKNVKSYLNTWILLLDGNDSPYRFMLGQILKLKQLPRQGWNSDKYSRKVGSCESIMDHTGHAAILALSLLPEKSDVQVLVRDQVVNEEYAEYDKDKIIRMILAHDIGEYKNGDIVSPLKTGEDEQAEAVAMEPFKVLQRSASGESKYFSQLGQTIYGPWKEFESQATINAKVARDIDLLECLVQLNSYEQEPTSTIPDYEEFRKNLISKITTVFGKEMVKKVSS